MKKAFTLAGATHVEVQHNVHKNAFTLAEVLITLGVIGVVAALTMPSLIANYKKQVYVIKLKKGYSVWNNAFKLMLAKDDVEILNDTEFARSLVNAGKNAYINGSSTTEADEILKKYINFIRIEESAANWPIKLLNGSDSNINWSYRKFYLPDGMTYHIRLTGLNQLAANSLNGAMFIDVNGDQPPNIQGRDIFYFYIYKTGEALAVGSPRWAEVYIPEDPESYITTSVDPKVDNGSHCSGYIMANGWVMDY